MLFLREFNGFGGFPRRGAADFAKIIKITPLAGNAWIPMDSNAFWGVAGCEVRGSAEKNSENGAFAEHKLFLRDFNGFGGFPRRGAADFAEIIKIIPLAGNALISMDFNAFWGVAGGEVRENAEKNSEIGAFAPSNPRNLCFPKGFQWFGRHRRRRP